MPFASHRLDDCHRLDADARHAFQQIDDFLFVIRKAIGGKFALEVERICFAIDQVERYLRSPMHNRKQSSIEIDSERVT